MALDRAGLLRGALTAHAARRIAAAARRALPRFPHAPPPLPLPPGLADAGRGSLAGALGGAPAFGADVPGRRARPPGYVTCQALGCDQGFLGRGAASQLSWRLPHDSPGKRTAGIVQGPGLSCAPHAGPSSAHPGAAACERPRVGVPRAASHSIPRAASHSRDPVCKVLGGQRHASTSLTCIPRAPS